MRCPKCNNNVYSHHQKINKSGTEIKRDYACRKCKCVFKTIEQIIKTEEVKNDERIYPEKLEDKLSI